MPSSGLNMVRGAPSLVGHGEDVALGVVEQLVAVVRASGVSVPCGGLATKAWALSMKSSTVAGAEGLAVAVEGALGVLARPSAGGWPPTSARRRRAAVHRQVRRRAGRPRAVALASRGVARRRRCAAERRRHGGGRRCGGLGRRGRRPASAGEPAPAGPTRGHSESDFNGSSSYPPCQSRALGQKKNTGARVCRSLSRA